MTPDVIIQLCSTLAVFLVTVVPLIIALINYVKKSVQEKNWNNLVQLVFNLIVEAEAKYEAGADKKAWVMGMVRASADTINFEISDEQLSQLIDNLIDLTKKVNIKDIDIKSIKEDDIDFSDDNLTEKEIAALNSDDR